MRRTVLALAVACALAGSAFAQIGNTSTADARVREALDKLEIEYEIDEDGDYRIVFGFEEDDRSQVAFINTHTEQLRLLEIREVWSPAYVSDRAFEERIANRLLEDSFDRKLGGWQTMRSGDHWVAIFSAKIAADADPAALLETLSAVMTSADEMEKELLGTDDF